MSEGGPRRGDGGDGGPEPDGAPGGGDARDDAWDGAVFDEEFVRGAEVSEPTARTRMLRARWRENPPEPRPWRADEPPAGWFWSRGRRRRRGWRRRKGE
ncbi:hypothetical protein GCM10010420_32830 [Streptomyces glaucosporus]|uniref:Uncharacterized protein n=1 Tax=Streptomyces glaucosporus TaxID=284044 RepID=A0ABN3IF51_9ACTN